MLASLGAQLKMVASVQTASDADFRITRAVETELASFFHSFFVINNDLIFHEIKEPLCIYGSRNSRDKIFTVLHKADFPPVLKLLPTVIGLKVVNDGHMVEIQSFLRLIHVPAWLC